MQTELLSKVTKIGNILNDSNESLAERFRALFTLKNIGGKEAIECIAKSFCDPSALLKHELAYCLGQMQDIDAIPYLKQVLEDTSQEPMVRHEAGEAIGAIGSLDSIELLEKYCNDPVQEVAETCQLAVGKIKSGGNSNSPYATVDPTPAEESKDVNELKNILLDDSKDLFARYKAMFALRNMNTEDAVKALCEGLSLGSALFRHEVAFVLGQLQNDSAVDSLEKVLADTAQNEMVRHEAAEALGSIASPRCYEILNQYLKDNSKVVAESCVIALDMADHENSNGEFQYANTASLV